MSDIVEEEEEEEEEDGKKDIRSGGLLYMQANPLITYRIL
jgi:hypothetical protein